MNAFQGNLFNDPVEYLGRIVVGTETTKKVIGNMIYQQSVFDPWPIESESVQAVITSPPYFALRKYSIPDVIVGGDKDCKHEWEIIIKKASGRTNGNVGNNIDTRIHYESQTGTCIHCNAWKGQYGLEPTPQMYVEHTRLWAKEAWRVLRNDGIMFLNLADSYAGGGKGNYGHGIDSGVKAKQHPKGKDFNYGEIPSKCQLLIPHRVAIALMDDGWTLRNTIIWYKSNGMPESVTDRFSKKYEYVFMFTKSGKYYFDLDAVREPHKDESIKRDRAGYKESPMQGRYQVEWEKRKGTNDQQFLNPLGKNSGDVWQIPTQPSSEKHFAMWPERLVERMIKCSTKAGDTVLDPFAGSGTTLKVAEQLYRKGIGIDLGYHEMSKRRISVIQKKMFV